MTQTNEERVEETMKDFEDAFMNNGVKGVLGEEYQDPKMVLIHRWLRPVLTQNTADTLERVRERVYECKLYNANTTTTIFDRNDYYRREDILQALTPTPLESDKTKEV